MGEHGSRTCLIWLPLLLGRVSTGVRSDEDRSLSSSDTCSP